MFLWLWLLFGPMLLLTTEYVRFSSPYVINSSGNIITTKPAVINLCHSPCSASCSPECRADCCVTKSQFPSVPSSSPAKPQMMISSVEEGETEECEDKGFGSPSDQSADPPGTITIPLPPTMYTPPKPGDDPKELPLPDFHLPAAIFEGKLPENSVTLSPVGSPAAAAGTSVQQGTESTKTPLPLQQGPESVKTPLPCITTPITASPPLSPPIIPPLQSVTVAPTSPKLPPVHVAPPPPAPPPCGVTQVMPSGGTLVYPKLPPVVVSEIPKKKIPISLQNRPPILNPLRPPSSTSNMLLNLPSLMKQRLSLMNCPSSCSVSCAADCRDECCKGAKSNTVPGSSHAHPPSSLISGPASSLTPSAGHLSVPSLPPVAHIAASSRQNPPVAPCAHAQHDSCVITFDPSAGSAGTTLHSYPPADMPTDVMEYNPAVVSLAAQPSLCEQKEKIEVMKEMAERLKASCGKT